MPPGMGRNGPEMGRKEPRMRHRIGRFLLSNLVKRSFSLAGHRTSVALEAAFWAELERSAAAQDRSLSALVAEVDAAREPSTPLASALRLHALREASLGRR
jgi:predicted DNA-binding ribbon-helix-helix protein